MIIKYTIYGEKLVDEFQSGDTVKLISKEYIDWEGSRNWITEESTKPQIGDIFTVKYTNMSEKPGYNEQMVWLAIYGLYFNHPSNKFKKVK